MTTSPVDLQGVSGGKDTKNIPNGEKKSEGKAEDAEGEGGKDREPAPQSGEKKVVRVEKESDMLLGGLKTTYYSDGSYMVETVNRGVTNSISRYNAKGEKDGRQETYDREGNLLEVGVYMDGQLDGVQELYIDGRLRQRMSYKGGKQNGVTETYNPDGSIARRLVYKDGEIVEGRADRSDRNDREPGLSEEEKATLERFDALVKRGREIKAEVGQLIGKPTKDNYDRATDEVKARVDALLGENRGLFNDLPKGDLLTLKQEVWAMLGGAEERYRNDDSRENGDRLNRWANLDSEIGRVLREYYGDENLYMGGTVVPFKGEQGENGTGQPRKDGKKQRVDGKAAKVSARERKLRDAVVDLLRKAGIDVVTESEEGQRVLDMANGRERQHRVYHGSGADFERFDHSHMGEGEGAQAFGWGTYVTEVEGIGKRYAETNGNRVLYKSQTDSEMMQSDAHIEEKTVVGWMLDGMKYGSFFKEMKSKIKKELTERIKYIETDLKERYGDSFDEYWGKELNKEKQRYDYLKKLKEEDFAIEGGNYLYTVEIPEDNGSNYLDWDKAVSDEDIAIIRNEMEKAMLAPAKEGEDDRRLYPPETFKGRENSLVEELKDKILNGQKGSFVYERIAFLLGGEKEASEFLHDMGYTGIKYPAEYYSGGRSDGAKNYVIFDEGDLQITDKVKFFRTESGEAYGFTMGGKIYLDPRIATAETPVHEYTHLWAAALRAANPKAWERLKETIFKDKELVDWVRRKYPELDMSRASSHPSQEKDIPRPSATPLKRGRAGAAEMSDELIEEVFAHFSGRRGAERLRAEQERMEGETQSLVGKAKVIAMFENLRDALKKFWDAARELFGGKSVKNKSAEDFADMVLGDLVGGFNPRADAGVKLQRSKADGQTKSENFKKWFGDWEKAQRIEKLRKSTPITATGEEYKGKYELNNQDAERYILNELRGEYTNQDTGDKVIISRKGADKVTRHDADNDVHLKSIALIPQMIENAIFIDEDTNTKSVTGFDSYRYYVTGINIGGEDYTAKIVVGVKDGEIYYDHALTQIEKGKLLDSIDPIKRGFADKEQSFNKDNVKDKRLLSILENNSSKVVDEDGKPLVVYHSTTLNSTRRFFKFNTKKPAWFTPSRGYSEAFTTKMRGTRSFTYPVYLNIKNPIDVGDIDGIANESNIKRLADYTGIPVETLQEILSENGGLNIFNITNTERFKELLQAKGYDGIIAREGGVTSYAVFEPTQIKSATENVGTFDGENPDIRYQKADSGVRFRGEEEPVFYSNAMRAVENIKQERATPEQWVKMIEKQGGLKAGEDKWLGLGEWLRRFDGRDGANGRPVTLTKGEVLDYIRENEIRVEEVEYSERNKEYTEYTDYANRYVEEHFDDFNREDFEEYMYSKYPELKEKVESGEIVEADNPNDVWFNYHGNGNEINETRLSYTTRGLDNKREIVLTVPTVEPWNEHDEVHFGEAGGGRAVAWVRFGETTDADGKRVLVIDEIQSKRHQEGREKGYREIRPHSRQEADLRKAANDAQERYDDYTRKMGEKYGGEYVDIYADMSEEERKEAYRLENAVYEADSAIEKHYSAVPDAPFDKNWHEVAMKRMLRFAAENGYDKVAWTKGEQQNERYNIGNVISHINIEPLNYKDEDFGYEYAKEIVVYTKDGLNNFVIKATKEGIIRGGDYYNGESLQNVFGKELAEKIMSSEGKTTIENDGLRIGGEGMKGFYDQILPRFMDKYGKRWGVKTGDVRLDGLSGSNGKNGVVMHAVDVTDDMRESVMRGQPLFRPKTQSREGGEEANAGDWYDRGSVERIGAFAEYSRERIEEMHRRQEQSARRRFKETAERLNLGDRIGFVDTIDELEGIDGRTKERRRRKKGWYDPRTRRIVVILGNHGSMDDVMRTILHEGVAHHGLRQLFGGHFDRFLDNVYEHADESERARIVDMARKHGWNVRTATEEYLATLAETTEFEKPENQSWWRNVKTWFFEMLHKIGFEMGDVYGTIGDNELRYILWRSYENLKEPGHYRSLVEEARDVAKQYELKVGEWAGNGRRGNGSNRVNGVNGINGVNGVNGVNGELAAEGEERYDRGDRRDREDSGEGVLFRDDEEEGESIERLANNMSLGMAARLAAVAARTAQESRGSAEALAAALNIAGLPPRNW